MKVNSFLLFLGLMLDPALTWAGVAVHDACRRLCENEAECLRRCISHSELFELNADFVNACTDYNPSVEVRMKVLRSGATRDLLPLCKDTGWGIDNVLICLRSYPTPEVLKACKKLSPKEEDQVRCLRSGNTNAQIEGCFKFGDSTKERLSCLDYHLDIAQPRRCREKASSAEGRLACMDQTKKEKERETREHLEETRKRVLADEEWLKQKNTRMPASSKANSPKR
jgi:hypothetical protein